MAMLDRLVEPLSGNATGGLSQVVKEIRVPRGTASKVANRLGEKFRVKKAK